MARYIIFYSLKKLYPICLNFTWWFNYLVLFNVTCLMIEKQNQF